MDWPWERRRYTVHRGQESGVAVVVGGIDLSQGCFEEGGLKGQDGGTLEHMSRSCPVWE